MCQQTQYLHTCAHISYPPLNICAQAYHQQPYGAAVPCPSPCPAEYVQRDTISLPTPCPTCLTSPLQISSSYPGPIHHFLPPTQPQGQQPYAPGAVPYWVPREMRWEQRDDHWLLKEHFQGVPPAEGDIRGYSSVFGHDHGPLPPGPVPMAMAMGRQGHSLK